MLDKLIKQEIEPKKRQVLKEANGYLSPKIDVEKLLSDGCITADDYHRQIGALHEEIATSATTDELIKRLAAIPYDDFMNSLKAKINNYDTNRRND